jgi:hypothetical protein
MRYGLTWNHDSHWLPNAGTRLSPGSDEADDGVRAQGCGETRLLLEGGRGLLIEDDDGAVLFRLVEEFGCVQRALAGAAATVAVHLDSHAVITPTRRRGGGGRRK